ncbi:MAG: dTDP-4-dehydrorhamnose reductase [Myxococcota bacterium]
MKILLTGAGGQLGRAVCDAFTSHEVVGRDHAALDVADAVAVEAALDATRPDLLLNASAYTAVDRAEDEPEAAFRVNAEGPGVLAVATARRGLPLLHVSTDYVFDGEKGAAYVESDPTRPLGVYGVSKLAGEEAVRAANPRHFVVRTAWLYGPVGRNFARTLAAAAEREPRLRVVDDQWGSPTYAPHLARALAALVGTQAHGLHHLANAGVASRFEFAKALLDALGSATPIEPIPTSAWPTPARRPRNTALASERETGIGLPDWRVGVQDFAAAVERPL